jgi:predicted esterase
MDSNALFRPMIRRCFPAIAALATVAYAACPAQAQKIRLKDGRILTGVVARTTGVADNPNSPSSQAGEVATKPILMVDDQLRRVYVCQQRAAEVLNQAPEPLVVVRPWQNPALGAGRLISVGPAVSITPFDEYGRRIYEMQSPDGLLSIVQGISELTPRYAKVESLQGPQRSVAWDMRMATSSIPPDALARILAKAIPQNDPQARLQEVRFYQQAGRYPEARRELERIVQEFPQMKDLQNMVEELRRASAGQLFKELELRRAAGQHKLVETTLANFPTEQVGGETLVQVRQLLKTYEQESDRIKRIAKALQETIGKIADPDHRGLAAPLVQEIVKELTHNNVNRLASFVQLIDDPSLTSEEKISLAITGWFLGQDGATRDMPSAISLLKVRDAVLRYLREGKASERQLILNSIQSMEGASVDQLAKLIANMKPPRHEAALAATHGGFLELTAPGQTQDGDFTYYVQLPPEYDPYRRYPTIIALNGAYNTPVQALDFWTGEPTLDEKKVPTRRGHAMRHGYVTIAVDWQKPHQYEYEYSAREHVAVLTCLRDAMRRFSIDTDRVYLTGHDIGGEAAWDMAQAHPDLWAGAIPFIPRFEEQQKYIGFYRDNAEYVPLYFVAGELDGRSIAENAPVWNKYLRVARYDVTLVEYQGRGHEPFHDEILTLFDWMSFKKRVWPPKEFACSTLRPWDNFFWWLECEEFPPNFMIYPTDWSGARANPAQISGKQQPDNRLAVKTPAKRTTIWLSPDIVDFSKPIKITFGSHNLSLPPGGPKPDPLVLLEDVRTRGDRQRPFWAKVDVP